MMGGCWQGGEEEFCFCGELFALRARGRGVQWLFAVSSLLVGSRASGLAFVLPSLAPK
jgi:hypothetical protein